MIPFRLLVVAIAAIPSVTASPAYDEYGNDYSYQSGGTYPSNGLSYTDSYQQTSYYPSSQGQYSYTPSSYSSSQDQYSYTPSPYPPSQGQNSYYPQYFDGIGSLSNYDPRPANTFQSSDGWSNGGQTQSNSMSNNRNPTQDQSNDNDQTDNSQGPPPNTFAAACGGKSCFVLFPSGQNGDVEQCTSKLESPKSWSCQHAFQDSSLATDSRMTAVTREGFGGTDRSVFFVSRDKSTIKGYRSTDGSTWNSISVPSVGTVGVNHIVSYVWGVGKLNSGGWADYAVWWTDATDYIHLWYWNSDGSGVVDKGNIRTLGESLHVDKRRFTVDCNVFPKSSGATNIVSNIYDDAGNHWQNNPNQIDGHLPNYWNYVDKVNFTGQYAKDVAGFGVPWDDNLSLLYSVSNGSPPNIIEKRWSNADKGEAILGKLSPNGDAAIPMVPVTYIGPSGNWKITVFVLTNDDRIRAITKDVQGPSTWSVRTVRSFDST